MQSSHIVVIGGLTRRHITEAAEVPGLGETIETTSFKSHTGGRGAYAAVAAHRLSHFKPTDGTRTGRNSAFGDLTINVHLVATVGDDATGNLLKERITECGVNATEVKPLSNASTSRAVIVVDQKTKDHRTWFHAGANHMLLPDDFRGQEKLERFAGGVKPDLLLTNLELRRDAAEQLIRTAGRAQVDVLLNLVPANDVLHRVQRYITHLVTHKAEVKRSVEGCPTNDDDLDGWIRIAKQYRENGAKNVVITLGAHGACFANKFEAGLVPIGNYDVNNRVGGG